jgi:hypothetical protein
VQTKRSQIKALKSCITVKLNLTTDRSSKFFWPVLMPLRNRQRAIKKENVVFKGKISNRSNYTEKEASNSNFTQMEIWKPKIMI